MDTTNSKSETKSRSLKDEYNGPVNSDIDGVQAFHSVHLNLNFGPVWRLV